MTKRNDQTVVVVAVLVVDDVTRAQTLESKYWTLLYFDCSTKWI